MSSIFIFILNVCQYLYIRFKFKLNQNVVWHT